MIENRYDKGAGGGGNMGAVMLAGSKFKKNMVGLENTTYSIIVNVKGKDFRLFLMQNNYTKLWNYRVEDFDENMIIDSRLGIDGFTKAEAAHEKAIVRLGNLVK